MPDFDIDFCMDRRDEVIAYVQQKYGETSVGQIATFAELKSQERRQGRRALHGHHADRGAADREPHPAQDARRDVHDRRGARASSRSSRRSTRRDPRIKELLDQATQARGADAPRGQARGRHRHQRGAAVGPRAGLQATTRAARYVTQYYKDDVEQAGLVKFDFLGLKTLTVLDIAVRLINARPDFVARDGASTKLRPRAHPDGRRGDLQAPRRRARPRASSSSSRAACSSSSRTCRPDCFEDIVAAVALYRPGPLGSGMVDGLRQPQARPRRRSRACTRWSTSSSSRPTASSSTRSR